MTLRRRHGTAARGAYVAPILETLPADELPAGVPGDPARSHDPQTGRFVPGNTAARAGGLARAAYARQAAGLGLAELPEASTLRPYREHARAWRDAVAADMAATVGGGLIGPMVGSLLDSAALSLMWSRHLSDAAMTSGDAALALAAGKHAETSSRLVREAWEYAAREAESRGTDDAAELRASQAAFQARLAGK